MMYLGWRIFYLYFQEFTNLRQHMHGDRPGLLTFYAGKIPACFACSLCCTSWKIKCLGAKYGTKAFLLVNLEVQRGSGEGVHWQMQSGRKEICCKALLQCCAGCCDGCCDGCSTAVVQLSVLFSFSISSSRELVVPDVLHTGI